MTIYKIIEHIIINYIIPIAPACYAILIAKKHFKKNTALEIEKFLIDAHREYINTKYEPTSDKYNKNQECLLMAIDTCCKYVINGLLDRELCNDVLLRYILSFDYPIDIELKQYKNINKYIMEILKLNSYSHNYFSTEEEMLKAGLLVKNKDKKEYKWDRELIVGTWNKQDLVVCGGDQFVSLAAPIGTNKDEGFIIPNCLNYQHNLVVNDPSGKHRQLTARYREDVMGHKVFVFEPFSDKTHYYNPFHYIDFDPKNTDFYGQVDTLARFFFPKEPDATELSLHMTRSLFNILLHVYRDLRHTENGKRFCNEHKLSIPDTPTCHFVGSLVNGFEIPGKCADLMSFVDLLCEENILTKDTIEYWRGSKGMYDAPNLLDAQKRYTDVFKTFEDPVLRRFTESNDLDFRDLRRKKVDIFFTISPDDQPRASLITRLFFSSLIIENLNQAPIPRRVCCMLMDEFDKLGYLDIFARFVGGLGNEGASPTMASYDMRMVMIYSNDAQLEKDQPLGYGKNKAECLRNNCVRKLRYKKSSDFKSNIENFNKPSRSLIIKKIIEDFENIEKNDDFIFLTNNCPPIKTHKAFYHEDTYFTDRLWEVSPHLQSKYKKGQLPRQEDITYAAEKGELDCKLKRHTKDK
ncbi:type IV secretory system conjugative DNA transfer family protein [Helicobacter felistomachi]|uniref:type IV secretory system conjugative DNA transfer family protein n=1 Tax=Helicobacter felistomachi TaxID=3040201 RepID=UPI0025732CA5|nr:type IV secretory system conjugative DNA transfer family protein [Helicobacter sp. NHP21005]